MSGRRLIILGVAAAALLAAAIVLNMEKKVEASPEVVLIQKLDPLLIRKVVVKSGPQTVTIFRDSRGFHVAEKNNYDASLEAIQKLWMTCLDARGREKVTEDRANLAALGIADDSPEAKSVCFYGEKGVLLGGLVIRDRGDEQFVRAAGGDTVYRSSDRISFRTDPLDYVERQIVDMPAGYARRVQVSVGTEPAYTLVRQKDEVTLAAAPAGKRVRQADAGDVMSALRGLDMVDLRPYVEVGEWTGTYRCELANGLVYVVDVGKKDGRDYVKLRAEMLLGPEPPDANVEAGAKEFNLRHRAWAYEIRPDRAERLRTPLDDLVEDESVPVDVGEVRAQHIRIGYAGARGTTETRTREDARRLAEQVLREVKDAKADFGEVARKYSEDPDRVRGGDLGRFGRDKISQGFVNAAFNLKVGQVSGIVDTPYGFEIIKRTE